MSGREERRQPIPMPVSNREAQLPAAWQELIRFCRELKFGDIEHLNIQDGVPVLAEVTRKKVKFSRD